MGAQRKFAQVQWWNIHIGNDATRELDSVDAGHRVLQMHICSFGYLFNTLSQAIPPTSTLPPSTPIAMISTVLILALAFIGQIHAAPLFAHNISSLADASPDSPACNDIHNCRTLASIIYSCLATIFACTWGSYHPDIPKRTHTPWRFALPTFFSC